MSREIKVTTNYKIFKSIRGNRPITRAKAMGKAIQATNQLDNYPVLCYKDGNGKLLVGDGQNRLEAAEALNLPVSYFVGNRPAGSSDEDLIKLISDANSVVKPWSLSDHVHSWSNRAKPHPDYVYLKDYCKGYELSITYGAIILAGKAVQADQSVITAIKAGTFKAENKAFGEKVGPFFVQMRRIIGYSLPRSLIGALLRLCRLPDFNLNRMLKKMATHKAMFLRCGTWMQYVEILESIYNYHVSKPELTALKIAIQASERRYKTKHDKLKP